MKCFLRYVSARIEETAREKAYRIYVTDCLYVLLRGQPQKRYADLFETQKIQRDPEEIKESIKEKLRKMGGDDDVK